MRYPIWLAFGLMLSACASHPPPQTLCLISIEDAGAYCASSLEPQTVHFKSMIDLENYIARSPDDEKALIEWIKRSKK